MYDNFPLSVQELEQFRLNGYVVKKQLIGSDALLKAKQLGQEWFTKQSEPLELEAVVGYPGAPESIGSKGGQTIRRILSIVSRDPHIEHLATGGAIAAALEQLFEGKTPVSLNQSHHNCLMTKAPSFSSDTHWHQDVRYWNFESPNLISAWLALGDENANNGALQVIPGSHRVIFEADQFDAHKFFKSGVKANLLWINKAEQLKLEAGDVLFFDSRLLHQASRNSSTEVKFSMVFTYHDAVNRPISNTRSSRLPEIAIKVDI
ncbi:phytanoyl-CoA dioxygenase family protein [Reinekea sp.]|uniref:phytanoyl-CoA dioxygenase family protein n=3 Tax=Reinekea sp. TaxID=1970455 RepID=UPI0039897EA0